MRNIVVRSIRNFEYTIKAANVEASTIETIKVNAPSNLKHPEKQLAKYVPAGYVYVTLVSGPVVNVAKYFMETDEFMKHAEVYIPETDDVTDEDAE